MLYKYLIKNNIKNSHLPDIKINIKNIFKLNINSYIPAYSKASLYVPQINKNYIFDEKLTISIIVGFVYNRKIMISGTHGTGKSTHIEQISSRLNWPCIRLNLDSYISKIDLIGKHNIILKDNLQITKFEYGILPWSIRKNIVLILDDYDACKPEILYIIQKILESSGELILLDNNKIIKPHASFRIFSTCNSIDYNIIKYSGTYRINQAQLDRWFLIIKSKYLSKINELLLVNKKLKYLTNIKYTIILKNMIKISHLIRKLYVYNKIATEMSIRTLISWIELSFIFNSSNIAFNYIYLNRCNKIDNNLITNYYKKIFGILPNNKDLNIKF